MIDDRQTLVLTFVGVGLLLAAMGLPLALRKVRPNPIFGLRTPATMRNETVWYEANARSGWDMVVLGLVVAAAVTGLFLSPVPTESVPPMATGLLVGGVLLVGVRGWIIARRLERKLRE